MKISYIRGQITEIKYLAQSGNYKAARDLEGALYREVLEAIKKGAPNPWALASYALDSQWIELPR